MKQIFRSWKGIFLITLLGAWLRFYRLEATLQFLGDQGRDALVLFNLLVNYDLPFIGPITSVGGFYLGPLYYYLMAPFLWIFKFSPTGPAYATAAIGVVTVPILYLVTKKMFDRKAALFTSFLYAVGSVPVLETRGAWNPNPMPLAALGVVYGFFVARKTADRRWLWLSALSLGVALQLHYMIVFLGPFLLWQLWQTLKNKKLRLGILGWFLLIFISAIPLILFEIKNNFLNINGLFVYLTKNEYSRFEWWQTIKNLRGRSEEGIGMLLGFGRTTTLVRTSVTRLFLAGIAWLFWKNKSKSFSIIAGWLLLSVGALAFYRGGIPPYYLNFILPAVFILTGKLSNFFKIGWILVLVFLGFFGYFNYQSLQISLTARGNLKSVAKTARLIVDDVNQNQYSAYNLTLLDDTKDYRANAFRYFVTIYGGSPLGIDSYPQTEVLYVISPYKQENVLNEEIWEIKSLKPAELKATWELEGQENVYKIIKI
jgi:4-amino-4-deoxy-L-arabinose transferase-like glycosyltransferase